MGISRRKNISRTLASQQPALSHGMRKYIRIRSWNKPCKEEGTVTEVTQQEEQNKVTKETEQDVGDKLIEETE